MPMHMYADTRDSSQTVTFVHDWLVHASIRFYQYYCSSIQLLAIVYSIAVSVAVNLCDCNCDLAL